MSEPDDEMLLLFEFLPEKDDTDKEEINGTPDRRVVLEAAPRLRGARFVAAETP